MDQGSQQMQMTQSSAHRQQGMKNMWNNHHDEEAVVLPKGHYLQEATNISKTNRGEGTCQKATDDKTGLLAHTLSFDTNQHSHETCCAHVMHSQAKFIIYSMQGGGNNLLTFLNMQRESLL